MIGPVDDMDYLDFLVQPFRSPEGTICLDGKIKWFMLTLLLALQIICFVWFSMILSLVWNIVRGGTAKDSRSEDEGEDLEDKKSERPKEVPSIRAPERLKQLDACI